MRKARQQKDRYSILVIGGMGSAACVSRVENALRGVAGVEHAGVNLLTRMATVRHANAVHAEDLVEAVNHAGYQATLACPGLAPRREDEGGGSLEVIASRRSRFVAGLVLTGVILALDQTMLLSKDKVLWLFLLTTPVQITVGWEYYSGFFRRLRQRIFNLDSLVVMGSTAAYVHGFLVFLGWVTDDPRLRDDLGDPLFAAAAVILTVVSLGKWLESRGLESTARLWGSLSEMMPPEARVLREGREQVIPSGVVALGELVVVRPGEKIPVDGVVEEGVSEVNEALMTGEGRPVVKTKGDKVVVASINGTGKLRIRATGVGGGTALAQIANLVQNAQTRKAPVQKLADRLSGILVPIGFLLALVTFICWYYGPHVAQRIDPEWVSRLPERSWLRFLAEPSSLTKALNPTIAVLVVTCPFALGLATPTVVALATGLGARRGLLFKGAEAIEAAGNATDVVFDKTGVLTGGAYKVQAVLPAEGIAAELVLDLAGSLERSSPHPLAKAIVAEAQRRNAVFHEVAEPALLPGRGAKGRIGGKAYFLGSRELLQEAELQPEPALAERVQEAEAAGGTVCYLAEARGRVLGALVLADQVKETAPEAIAELRARHLRLHLLSGPKPALAASVGRQCGFKEEEIHAQKTTEEKIDFAWQLREQDRRLVLVGDGVNEAPIMAAADVGLVLGTGTDIAADSGSIVLVSSDPRGIARVLHLARASLRIIRWNLLFAFAFNAVMIPAAMLNQLDIGVAAMLMVCGSVLVVLNSLRVTRVCPKGPDETPPDQPHPSAFPVPKLRRGTSVVKK